MSRMMRSDSTRLRERGAKLKLSLPLIFWRGLMWKAPTSEPTKALTFASLMFETEDSNIKEAKVNAFVGSEVGAFHIKPLQKINGRDNFNFAPLSRSRVESDLIIRLIKSY